MTENNIEYNTWLYESTLWWMSFNVILSQIYIFILQIVIAEFALHSFARLLTGYGKRKLRVIWMHVCPQCRGARVREGGNCAGTQRGQAQRSHSINDKQWTRQPTGLWSARSRTQRREGTEQRLPCGRGRWTKKGSRRWTRWRWIRRYRGEYGVAEPIANI